MIDTKELAEGLVVKNHKELCELLSQEVKTGNSRKAQIKEFARYFSWEKSGQKYIITEIYPKPLPSQDKRKQGNHSIYVKYIEILLLSFLADKEGYTYSLTQKNWWKELGIVNQKYGRDTKAEKLYLKNLKKLDSSVTDFEINNFFGRTHRRLTDLFTSALKSLRNRRLIDFEKHTVINKGGKKYYKASPQNLKDILDTERTVLEEMGYEKMIQVQLSSRTGEFYERVNEILWGKYKIAFYFKQIQIVYVHDQIIKALPDVERELEKELLNSEIIKSLNKQADELYEEKRNAYLSGESNWCPPQSYIYAQRFLTDQLIKLKNEEEDIDDIIESIASEEIADKANLKELDILFDNN